MEQYKVIETKFISATNNRGSRIKAFDGNGNQVTIGYPHELSGVECHFKAAKLLCEKMKWDAELIGGWTSKGCAFVLQDKATWFRAANRIGDAVCAAYGLDRNLFASATIAQIIEEESKSGTI